MPRKRDFFHTGLQVSRSDLENLPYTMYGANPTGAQDYFVDLNAKVSEDGLSWDTPVTTVAAALALSDASIGLSSNRWWARRNRVFVCGDGIAETLVLAAEKTDLIGVGYDISPFPKITGNFTVGTAVNGFRMFNIGFIPTTTDPIITYPSGMHGWEMYNVHLYKVESVLNSAGLQVTDSRDWVMQDVYIYPDAGAALNTIGFNVAGTTAGMGRAKIFDSLICGVEGINVVDTSAYFEGAICKNSVIIATNLCIDDNSDTIAFINNRLITAAASGSAAGSGIVDWNAALAAENWAHSSDGDGPLPDLNAHG